MGGQRFAPRVELYKRSISARHSDPCRNQAFPSDVAPTLEGGFELALVAATDLLDLRFTLNDFFVVFFAEYKREPLIFLFLNRDLFLLDV